MAPVKVEDQGSGNIALNHSPVLVPRLLGFERGHINREPVLHIRLEQPLVSFVDLLDRDDFHIRGDVVLSAEIEHLLGFADAANVRAREIAIAHKQSKGSHCQRLRRRADNRQITASAQQIEICIDGSAPCAAKGRNPKFLKPKT